MDTTVADALIGTLIDGRYRLRARVARGGMATVYTALDERLERTVAVKIIHPGQANDPNFLDRFADEAKTIARLTHPNVVAVYDQGTHDGLPYLVMEFVRGRTLRDVLGERRRLSPPEALAIMEQMLAAIAAAHRAGLVHRDVKPENVLVAEAPTAGTTNLVDGVVKVADFGLARAVEEATADESGGQLMATAAYVAPELVAHGHADPRTDVYSAGVVLFEMLTGRVPYDGDRPVDVAWQHVDHDVPPPSRYVPGLPPVLDELVVRATRRDPGGRPTDAGAMLAEVQSARDDIGLALASRPRPTGPPTVVVPQVDPARPAWARLPARGPAGRPPAGRVQPPHQGSYQSPRRRATPTFGDRFARLRADIQANPRARLAIAASIVALGLLAAVGGWWFGIGRYTTAPSLVAVPAPQAQLMAQRAGFTVRFDKGRHDEKVPKDTVLAQQPGPGQRIVGGGTITLTVSLGPERYPVPDVVGKEYDLAVQDLQKLRLVAQRADTFSDAVPAGSIAETNPPVGTLVPPGATVVLKVSKGRAPITMPSVMGKSLDDATNTLRHLGLDVAVKHEDSDKPKDQVIRQEPVDGAGLEKGATVTITVSNGPPDIEVPDVTGRSIDEARDILTKAGLQVQAVGLGTVRVQNPPAHQHVPPNTTVVIWAFG